jgi:hypothetical protein
VCSTGVSVSRMELQRRGEWPDTATASRRRNVGKLKTVLNTKSGKWRVRFPMVSLEFSVT